MTQTINSLTTVKTIDFPLARKLHFHCFDFALFFTISGRYAMPLYRNSLFLILLIIAFSSPGAFCYCHHDDNCDSAGSSAFVLSPQIIWLDNGPLKDLIAKERDLRDHSFNVRGRDPVFMLGFGGIHDHGNSLRIGFSLYGGYKSYESKTFTGGTTTTPRDSVIVLRFIPVYGGVSFDKIYRFYEMTISFGAMLGGGVFILNREFYDVEGSGAFTDASYDDEDDNNDKDKHDKKGDWAFAGTAAFDFHAGVSFKLAPLLSLGIEASALCFYSPEGYGYATGEFFTISPGLRMRLNVGRAS
jgi:hypothetical protein